MHCRVVWWWLLMLVLVSLVEVRGWMLRQCEEVYVLQQPDLRCPLTIYVISICRQMSGGSGVLDT